MCPRWLEGIVKTATCYKLGVLMLSQNCTHVILLLWHFFSVIIFEFTFSLYTLNVGCVQGAVLSVFLCEGSHLHAHSQTRLSLEISI